MPASWVWGDHGFLRNYGYVDFAGAGGIHLVGGITGNCISQIFLGFKI